MEKLDKLGKNRVKQGNIQIEKFQYRKIWKCRKIVKQRKWRKFKK